jgi:hypothetical protein
MMTRSEIIAGSNKISGNVILRDLVEEGFANLPYGRWGSAQRLHYLSGANALCAQNWNSIIWRQENSGMREPVKTGWLPFVRCMVAATQVATLCAKGFAFLCLEDNMSQDLAEKFAPHHKSGEVFPLFATQGTGILSAPVSRLRVIWHSTFARSSLFPVRCSAQPPWFCVERVAVGGFFQGFCVCPDSLGTTIILV